MSILNGNGKFLPSRREWLWWEVIDERWQISGDDDDDDVGNDDDDEWFTKSKLVMKEKLELESSTWQSDAEYRWAEYV